MNLNQRITSFVSKDISLDSVCCIRMIVQANSLFIGDLLFTLAQNYHRISLFHNDDYQ